MIEEETTVLCLFGSSSNLLKIKICFKEKTLFAVRMDLMKEIKKHALCEEILKSDQQYLITFEEFSLQTDKNKVLQCNAISPPPPGHSRCCFKLKNNKITNILSLKNT